MSTDDAGRPIECATKSLAERVKETLRLVDTARDRLREKLFEAKAELAKKTVAVEALQSQASDLVEHQRRIGERMDEIQSKMDAASRELEGLRKERNSLDFKGREVLPTIRVAQRAQDEATEVVKDIEDRIVRLDESEPLLSELLRDHGRAQEARDRAENDFERAAYDALLDKIDWRTKGILASVTSDAQRSAQPRKGFDASRSPSRTKECRCRGANPDCRFCGGRGFV